MNRHSYLSIAAAAASLVSVVALSGAEVRQVYADGAWRRGYCHGTQRARPLGVLEGGLRALAGADPINVIASQLESTTAHTHRCHCQADTASQSHAHLDR
jgi:hypothetical protein